MPICTKCRMEKDVSKFPPHKQLRTGHHTQCRECRSRQSNKRLQESLGILNNLKEKLGCALCNERTPCSLDFHHVDINTKINTVARLRGKGSSMTAVWQEIEKCILLCANCHRKHHQSSFQPTKNRRKIAAEVGESKKCGSCLKILDVSLFYGKSAICKKCQIEKQEIKRKKLLQELNIFKSSLGCYYCSEDCCDCLDFHHWDISSKEYAVASLVSRNSSYDVLWNEIQKCVVVCANCHRKIHNELLHDFHSDPYEGRVPLYHAQ